jgi:predicted CoA-binding protein
MKKTLILGANNSPEKYAYKAAHMLVRYGHEIVPVGLRSGEVAGQTILTGQPVVEGVDTVTLYISPKHQTTDVYSYIIKMKPKRVIFNPGTENYEFMDLLEERGIEPLEACTLVLLASQQY